MFTIIAAWDVQNRPTRTNNRDTLAEAQALVVECVAKGYAGAFYIDETATPDADRCWRDPRHWTVDPVAKTATLNSAALSADRSAASKTSTNTPILAQIAAKEMLTLRPMRELRRADAFGDVAAGAVTAAKNKLKTIDDEIAALRATLVP